MGLALTNSSAIGLISYETLKYGRSILDRCNWSESRALTGHVTLGLTLLLSFVSLVRHGVLPAFFTFLAVFNGLCLYKFVIWSALEIHATFAALRSRMTWKGLSCFLLLALVHSIVTQSTSDAIRVLLAGMAIFWAVRVEKKLNIVDTLFVLIITFFFGMSLHQTFYHRLHQEINQLYEVGTQKVSP